MRQRTIGILLAAILLLAGIGAIGAGFSKPEPKGPTEAPSLIPQREVLTGRTIEPIRMELRYRPIPAPPQKEAAEEEPETMPVPTPATQAPVPEPPPQQPEAPVTIEEEEIPLSGAETPDQMEEAPPQPAPLPASEEQFLPETGIDEDITQEVLRLINEERTAHGLSPLVAEAGLTAAANIRAREIVSSYSHTRPNGSRCFTAISNREEYTGVAENICKGYKSAAKIMEAFLGSPGHRDNILGNYDCVGVSVYRGEDGKLYCAQLFGRLKPADWGKVPEAA